MKIDLIDKEINREIKSSYNYLSWREKFKPQSQSIIQIVLWLGALFGIAVITWYYLVHF